MINSIIRTANKFLEKRNRNATRDDFYYNKIYFKRTETLYNLFLKNKEDGKVCATALNIEPAGVKFGNAYREVINAVGKPGFIYDNKNSTDNHKAVFVRQTSNNLNVLFQLQFYNNQLFFIGLDLSRNIRHENDKITLINGLTEKYLNKPFKKGDEYPVIEDAAGNFMIINDDVYFSVCYYGNNLREAFPSILSIIESSDSTMNKKDKENMFYSF